MTLLSQTQTFHILSYKCTKYVLNLLAIATMFGFSAIAKTQLNNVE